MFHKGSARRETTDSAHTPTRAVGYVRVSTDAQRVDGISIDAQTAKLKAYCTLHDIHLVSICSDVGQSAGTLRRPGLQQAVSSLTEGKADALIVCKLDRLTRSVRDLGQLCADFFSVGKPWALLSVADSVDTRTAGGQLVLNVLTSVAEWERSAASERTRDGMRHLQQEGVYVGAAPYGWRYSAEADSAGRRQLVEDAAAQQVIGRIGAMHRAGQRPCAIARQLRAEGLPSPRGGRWSTSAAQRVLERSGFVLVRRQQRPMRQCDMDRARELASAGRAAGLSLREIAKRLDESRLSPRRGGAWHAASVLVLLQERGVGAQERALQLHAAGLSIRQIGVELSRLGYVPAHAAAWHNRAVASLIS